MKTRIFAAPAVKGLIVIYFCDLSELIANVLCYLLFSIHSVGRRLIVRDLVHMHFNVLTLPVRGPNLDVRF